MSEVTGLIGIYHAHGGLVGEARYVVGKLLGTTHCALCDITHSPVRRKRAWDAMVERLGIPFTLLHLNEMPADVAAAVAEHGSPAVLARAADGSLTRLLGAVDLERMNGSVEVFEVSARALLAGGGLRGPRRSA